MKVLVIGGGSIGKRHLRNALALGAEVVGVVEVKPERRQEVEQIAGRSVASDSIEEAVRRARPDAAVIGTPTGHHRAAAELLMARDIPFLIEKPLTRTLAEARALLEQAGDRDLVVLVGYTYRFWPPLQRVKRLLDAGAVGDVLGVRIEFSEYLPDWHPWEDYRRWFMASAEQGGGALLDESHTLDLLRWFCGEVRSVAAVVDTSGALEITSDDRVALIARMESGAVAEVHMDLLGRAPRKNLVITGSTGTILWDFHLNRVEVYEAEPGVWTVYPFKNDRNDMFVEELRHFFECVEGKADPRVPLLDGARTMALLEAVRDAAARGVVVRVPDVAATHAVTP
jgi:predicted dehydrogenase